MTALLFGNPSYFGDCDNINLSCGETLFFGNLEGKCVESTKGCLKSSAFLKFKGDGRLAGQPRMPVTRRKLEQQLPYKLDWGFSEIFLICKASIRVW
jgi:hypothetical protein